MFEGLRNHWARWLLAVAVLAHLLMMGSLFWGYFDPLIYSSDRSTQAVDFFAIYEAGHRAIENRSVYASQLGGWSVVPYASPYRYVPIFAYVVGAPLNALPSWWTYWGWVAFNELLLILNAYATWRIAGRGRWGVIAAAMWFVFTPFYLEQYMGQFSFLMATALFWTGVGLLRGRELLAGIPWALSLVTKSNSAVLAPVFLRLGWWRALAGGAALVGLNAFYFLWRPDDLQTFVGKNLTNAYNLPPFRFIQYWPAQHGLTDFIENTYLAVETTALQTPRAYTLIPVSAVIAISLAVTFFARRTDPLALFAVWTAAFFLAYNDVWEFHYVMLLPALVLLVTHRPAFRPLALAVFVLIALPAPHWPFTYLMNDQPLPNSDFSDQLQILWPAWGTVVYHAAKPIPTLVLWAYLVAAQWGEGIAFERIAGPWNAVQGRLVLRAKH